MPPFQRVPGLGPPEGWGEEEEEGWEEDEEGWEEEEEGETYVRVCGLEDLAPVINNPDEYPNRDNVCVVRVPFRDAPLMLERLREAVAADIGILFVGNLDRLRQASDLHAALCRLSGSLGSLHKTMADDGSIDWSVVGAIEDAPPLLHALFEMQPESLRDTALPLLEDVKMMINALPNKLPSDAADAGPKYPEALLTALISRVGDLLQAIDELVLGDVILEFPEADSATFLALKKEGAQEEQQQQQQERYVVRIQGRQNLNSIFEEPEKYYLQEHFSVAELQFADAPSMFKGLWRAVGKKGWWVGNLDRLQQASELNASLSRISRSLGYVQMGLEDNSEIDWFEVDSIRETTPKLAPLCELQPDDLRIPVLTLIPRIEATLAAFPEKPIDLDDEHEYPPELFDMLISRVGSLPGDIDALGGMIIQYPDAEAPPPSPPPQPPVP